MKNRVFFIFWMVTYGAAVFNVTASIQSEVNIDVHIEQH